MSDNRTEKPTGRRLQDARRRGQVARSRDLGQAASLLATVVALAYFGTTIVRGLADVRMAGLKRVGEHSTTALDGAIVTALAVQGAISLVWLVGPVAAVAGIAAVAAQVAQGGWLFSTEALSPNWGRLNPMNGLKRLGPTQGGLDLLKALVAVTVVSVIGYLAVAGSVAEARELVQSNPRIVLAQAGERMRALLTRCGIAFLTLAAADYGLQRWRFMRSLRMTKQEVKDDHRLSEGNPEIKARVRRVQREMARRRILSATAKATVVITNPTHYAVALEYRRGVMVAPRVVAKGRGVLAQRIKDVAREHGVPMIENVPLARALYHSVEIDEFIPPSLFEAVAEVLAYLVRIGQARF